MSFQNQQKKKAQSVFMSSIELFANTAAFVVTFFALPLAHDKSVGWVMMFTRQFYSEDFAWVIFFVWYLLLGLMIFSASRASLSTLLIIGGVAIAARFL